MPEVPVLKTVLSKMIEGEMAKWRLEMKDAAIYYRFCQMQLTVCRQRKWKILRREIRGGFRLSDSRR